MKFLHLSTRILARCLAIVLLGMLVLIMAVLLVTRAHGEQLLSVQTGSMAPTLQPGDAVVVEPVQPSDLRPGDVISYQSPRSAQLIITHRLVSIDRRSGWLTTEGDALHTPDPTFAPRLLVGRVI